MTQEILDYLLTRSLLINNDSDEIIEAIDSKEIFEYIIDNISNLMQEEDFALVFNGVSNKIIEIVNSYRFECNKDKKINDEINYIIGRIGEYKAMSPEYKKHLVNSWIREESKNRQLPLAFQTYECLEDLVRLDCKYLKDMVEINKPMVVTNILEYITIINIIINKFPDIFEDAIFYETTIQNFNVILNAPKLPHVYLKMIKKSLKELKKLTMEKNKEKQKKKTNN